MHEEYIRKKCDGNPSKTTQYTIFMNIKLFVLQSMDSQLLEPCPYYSTYYSTNSTWLSWFFMDIHIELFHTCTVIKLHKCKCNKHPNLDVTKSTWLNTLRFIFHQTNHRWNYGSQDRSEDSWQFKGHQSWPNSCFIPELLVNLLLRALWL